LLYRFTASVITALDCS